MPCRCVLCMSQVIPYRIHWRATSNRVVDHPRDFHLRPRWQWPAAYREERNLPRQHRRFQRVVKVSNLHREGLFNWHRLCQQFRDLFCGCGARNRSTNLEPSTTAPVHEISVAVASSLPLWFSLNQSGHHRLRFCNRHRYKALTYQSTLSSRRRKRKTW